MAGIVLWRLARLWYLFSGIVFALCGVVSSFVASIVHIEDNGHPAQEANPVTATLDAVTAGESGFKRPWLFLFEANRNG